MASFTPQPLIVQDGEGLGPFAMPVRLVNSDGTAYNPAGDVPAYVLPAATTNALGGVKLQVFGDPIGNAATDRKTNVAAAAGDAPTKAEYDALVTAYNATATAYNVLAGQFNRLISGLASSGVIQVPSGD